MKILPALAGSARKRVEAVDRALNEFGAYVYQVMESGNLIYKTDEQGQYTVRVFETEALKILRA